MERVITGEGGWGCLINIITVAAWRVERVITGEGGWGCLINIITVTAWRVEGVITGGGGGGWDGQRFKTSNVWTDYRDGAQSGEIYKNMYCTGEQNGSSQ